MDSFSAKLGVSKKLLYLLFISLFIFSYRFFIRPELGFIRQLNAEIQQQEEILHDIETTSKDIDQDKLAAMAAEANRIKNEYSLGLVSQLVLLDVNDFAREVGLELLSFTPWEGIEEADNDISKRNYDLILRGNMSNFLAWLEMMEQTTYYLTIEDFTLNNQTDINTAAQNAAEQSVFTLTISNVALPR